MIYLSQLDRGENMSELCHPRISNRFLLGNINNIDILQYYYILSILLTYDYSTSNIIFVILILTGYPAIMHAVFLHSPTYAGNCRLRKLSSKYNVYYNLTNLTTKTMVNISNLRYE